MNQVMPIDDMKLQDASPNDLREAATWLSEHGNSSSHIGRGFLIRMADLLDDYNCKSAAQFHGGLAAMYAIIVQSMDY